MNILEIKEIMRSGKGLHPHQINEMLVRLAGEYAYYAGLLEDILVNKPIKWAEHRKVVSSDKQADRQWDMSDNGKEEIGLRLRMKSIEKMMSALRSMAETARRELDNANI